jgi:periplasmic protein TonB
MIEEPASYPEGTQAMMAFINQNITYPESAREQKLQGRVFVRFVINKNGSICDIKVMKGVSAELNKESINVIKKMPNWIPGKNNGEAVRSRATIPISFKL